MLLNHVPVVRKRRSALIPSRASTGAAGWDLHACVEGEICLESREKKLIPCGIAVCIPEGYVGLIFPRSGLSVKHGISLCNCVGVIDSDYRGEIFVALKNDSNENYTIKSGDRIAQLIVLPFSPASFKEVNFLNDTERSEGAFGSTGR
ncbi:MAG: dUTP diphosphatase [Oscillospiraceae bacterium]|jgi:dUTP pyrophosphatase|nr:dUTP diphosphatase [Oscillospiraceae bacterium]